MDKMGNKIKHKLLRYFTAEFRRNLTIFEFQSYFAKNQYLDQCFKLFWYNKLHAQ